MKAKTGTSVQLNFGVPCLLPIRLYRRSSNSRHLKLITRFGDIDFTDEKRHTISMLESGQNKSIVVNIQTLSDEDGGFYILQCYQPPTLSIIRLSSKYCNCCFYLYLTVRVTYCSPQYIVYM